MMTAVASLRQFNRAYTQRIGVLHDSFLQTGRSLGPSRVLFEIGVAGASVGDLRRRLGLDSGYLSRLLRELEGADLVQVQRDPADGRQRNAHLTAKGRRLWHQLDDRSEALAHRLVAPLSPRQQDELAAAFAVAERLLRAATVGFEVVDPAAPAAREALAKYFAELNRRFRSGFDPGSAGAGHDDESLRSPLGAFVLVTSDGHVIGCGGVQRIDGLSAEIKRMWIDDDWRGLGLGRRLLQHLEERADAFGYSRVVLDTNERLLEAVTMYERAGYQRIGRYNDNPYAHHWFAKDLPAR